MATCRTTKRSVAIVVVQQMAAYRRSRPLREVSDAQEVDFILKSLQDACGPWHAMPRQRKIALLRQVRGRAIKASVDLGKATAKVRTLPSSQIFEIAAALCLMRALGVAS